MSNAFLSGSRAIARALGVSPVTVKRWHAAGLLPTRKIGRNTSPLLIERKALDALRGRKG